MNLFSDTEESLSPRESWIRKHGILCRDCGEDHKLGRWEARLRGVNEYAPTRDEALAALAARLWKEFQIKPWNA